MREPEPVIVQHRTYRVILCCENVIPGDDTRTGDSDPKCSTIDQHYDPAGVSRDTPPGVLKNFQNLTSGVYCKTYKTYFLVYQKNQNKISF